ncbi:MAG: type II toxin-antitoxin system prevent-host-death family antitoxin [Candidatus Omnitrophota bacterium]|jgi:prevent-host-death family protein|nr:MAG: type II toxin-antitoxin system prevent-host-death family antitoxin [Candidatus Omnitrophota bacterium]
MDQIGLHEAKTHLSDIITKVNEGNEYIITRRGIPVARLVPAEKPSREAAKKALERAKKLRETLSLGGLKIKDLIEEGRR